MTFKAWVIITIEVLLSTLIILVLCGRFNAEKLRANKAQALVMQQQQYIADMQLRQREVAALDARYTQELTDAQTTIDRLQRDVAAGRKRLYLKTRRSAMPEDKTPGASGMGDDATIELSSVARRNVLSIRSGIVSDQIKIKYLQDYIRQIIDERDKK
ncbi:lysis protein [Pantoea piersonii]|jgi:prophage endopeptidase|uniref:lysis protein n=1 Tax=Pantoea piersonii TaxID=2364647 RepID=UPI00142E5078|nr:lysis protein [Pantoea piersonii]MBZ6386786.1 lysis protein [Pantoea piersonii]MBZ6400065.1 lysis protein [Pantoea piersonii]MBZ6409119.1 lysis protein [Pantoea piersonii]MBZ6426116.1 lysis protein [Pantoea piersonii]